MSKVYICCRKYADRKKPSLVLDIGNQGTILATFRNDKMADLWLKVIGLGKAIVIDDDNIKSLDDLLESEVEDGTN